MDLPRGRATDALVALTVFAGLVLLAPGMAGLAANYAFAPVAALAEGQAAPVAIALSPLVSAFAQAGLIAAAFQAVLLLGAGRYVERAVGKIGVVLAFVVGAYGGALARLVLTPGSAVPGLDANGALFAVVGAYLMLYGLPRGLPVRLGGGRLAQIAALAGLWALVQLAFMVVSRGFDLSTQLIEPLGGLAAGVAVARPLLAWHYRKA